MSAPDFLQRSEQNARSVLRILLTRAAIAGVFVALVTVLVIPWWAAAILGLLTAVFVFVVIPKTVTPGLAVVLDAGPVTELEFPRLVNVVEGLCASTGVSDPELRVIREPGANLAVYGSVDEGVMVFTSGLLESLDRISLEGIVAEGLARLKSGDAELAGIAAVFVTGPLIKNGPNREGRPLAIASIAAKWRAARLSKLRGPQHEMLADLAAVRWTRYPPGLERALVTMEEVGTSVESVTWGTAHLWIASPLPDSTGSDAKATELNEVFGLHDSIEHRAALMAEL